MHYIFFILLLTACNLEGLLTSPVEEEPHPQEESHPHVLFYDNQLDLDTVLKQDKKSLEKKNKQQTIPDLSKESFSKNPETLVIIN